jgi:drug/metabolite transporter (DMT)-like permease
MRSLFRNNLITGCLCAIGCETLFGLSYVFTKQATSIADPFAFLGWRYLIAAIVMILLAVTGLIRVDLKGKKLRPLLLVALFNPSVYFIGETIGISHTTASESGVFLACIPVAALAASTLLLHKKPSQRQVIGILITLAGVSVTVLAVGASSSLSMIGYLFLVIAVISYALYAVFVDKASDFTGAEITFMMTLIGAVVFGVLAILEAGAHGELGQLVSLPLRETSFLVAILYQGICSSALGFFLSNMAIARIGVNRTSSFIGIATVVSIIAGVLALGESFSMFQMTGAAVIIAGVCIANSQR